MRPFRLILIILFFLMVSCQNSQNKQSEKVQAIDQETLIEINRKLVERAMALNRNYAKENSWDFIELKNGMIYEILFEGEGEKAVSRDLVSFSFKLFTLGNRLIYSSDEEGIRTFRVDFDEVEAGLNHIAKILNQGDSARLILPPHLAFGLPGDGKNVPPRTSLIYYLKLESILNQN